MRIVLSASLAVLLTGCSSLILRDEDTVAEKTGKVTARTLACLVTVCVSELYVGKAKDKEAAQPKVRTSGFHVPRSPVLPVEDRRMVIWGNHDGMVSEVMQWFSQLGGWTFVERARLQQIMDEQHLQLSSSPDSEGDMLKVGHLAGAVWVVFATAEVRSEQMSRFVMLPNVANPYAPPIAGGGTATVYHVSVSFRVVRVETGEVRASGSATFDRAISDPDVAVGVLTQWALARAFCNVEHGLVWSDAKGCRKPED